jgi:hypothetical protein
MCYYEILVMFRAIKTSSFMEQKTNFSILGGWYGLLPRFLA